MIVRLRLYCWPRGFTELDHISFAVGEREKDGLLCRLFFGGTSAIVVGKHIDERAGPLNVGMITDEKGQLRGMSRALFYLASVPCIAIDVFLRRLGAGWFRRGCVLRICRKSE